MHNRSKSKGSSYERALSKRFSQWWCEDDVSLFRNSGSGNRHVEEVFAGDICPASDKAKPWNLCIEVKKAENWSVDGFLQGNPSEPLLAYMLQCLSSSQVGCNKIPLLVCARNYQAPLCFLYPYSRVHCKGRPFRARLKWVAPLPEKLLKRYPWDGPVDFFCLHLESFFQTFARTDFLC